MRRPVYLPRVLLLPCLVALLSTTPSHALAVSTGASTNTPPSAAKAFVPKKKVKKAPSSTSRPMAVMEDEGLPLAQMADIDAVVDAPLLRDIETLSSMLSEVVRRDSPEVFRLYDELRGEGIVRANDPDNVESFEAMRRLAHEISPRNTLGVMRTFNLALNLVNAAEVHHRLRVMRDHAQKFDDSDQKEASPLPNLEDSVRGTIGKILEENEKKGEGKSEEMLKKEIFDRLLEQKVEIVLTAHPTEVNRKTLLKKYRKITDTLGLLDRPDLTPYEREEARGTLRQIVAALWGSDEIRRKKPTPQQEAAGGNAVIESVLWDAVPAYLRRLDNQCRISLGRGLPLETVPIKFASWIGGDRDGNPNVTPSVTIEVIARQRLNAAKLFLRDLDLLYNDLAMANTVFSPEVEELCASIKNSPDQREKYRRILGHLENRLVKTIRVCESNLEALTSSTKDGNASSKMYASASPNHANPVDWDQVEPIWKAKDLLEPLTTIHDSLCQNGLELVANGALSDTIRRLHVFGLTLVPLDIREESTKHANALNAITRHLGLGSYNEWDEETRINFLSSELSNKRPLFRTRDVDSIFGDDPDVVKTLKVFYIASGLSPESLGAYVISQARSASDVLAVMLLQKQFGMTSERGNMMRVVPLFETLNDLTNSADQLTKLFEITTYIGAIKGKQEVMVGYSDSAKDAGRLAACWAQYTAQEKMVAVAEKYNVQLTFFHGKGGTVGRGGNPALYRAILSHPPGTINGRFRVTEQGEMITQNFGSPDIAQHTLDIYTAAVLREGFTSHVLPTEQWRQQMQRISDTSCAGYRHLVREEPRFVPYFRQATPELELGSLLNIGSRPAKRNPKGGIESLRAIPWTFAWTQTRTHLSAWLGVCDGLSGEATTEDVACMKDMYENWPWFREIIDLIAMILSKTDFSISENYDHLLVDSDIAKLGDEVRDKLVETRKAILNVSGSNEFAGPHVQLLRASTKIRNPFVDSINCVQAELLKELRNMPSDEDCNDDVLETKNTRKDALVVSVNGIAQGMRNSG